MQALLSPTACVPLACFLLALPAAAQGQPVTVRSQDAGLAVEGLRAGFGTATNGTAALRVSGPPGSGYILAMQNPFLPGFPFDVANAPVAGAMGATSLVTPFLVPAAWVNDPTGAPVYVIPPGGTQTLNFNFVMPAALIGFPLRFQAAVFGPASTYLTDSQTRMITPPVAAGTYVDSGTLAPPGPGILRDVEQADVDGDGDLDDLILPTAGAPLLFLQAGGGLAAPLPQPVPPTIPQTAEFADLDRDGFPDLVIGGVTNGGVGTTYLGALRNLGDAPWGGFALVPAANVTLTAPGLAVSVNDVETGDVNLDGFVDVVAGCGLNAFLGEQNRLFLNTSCPGFATACVPNVFLVEVTPTNMPPVADDTEDVEFLDFDLDGDLDVMVGNFDGPTAGIDWVLVNQGGAQGGLLGVYLLPLPNPVPPLADETLDVVVGDYNGDGLPDVYVANWLVSAQIPPMVGTVFGPGAQIDRLLLNTAGGVFVDSSTLLPDNPGYTGPPVFAVPPFLGMDAEAFDYDQDGDVDVIVPLGGFGNMAAGAPLPGFNRGLIFLRNNLANPASLAFENDLVPGGTLTMVATTADYVDVEPGDWQLFPLIWSWFVEDLGAVSLNAGFFWVGKQP